MHDKAPRMLAVVRCGDQSLHRSWAVGDPGFDVAVSYFGNDQEAAFPEATYVHRYKGGKWDGIFAFFQAFPQTLRRYDYVWFPDDDIAASAGDVNELIRCGHAHGLDLFQPALDTKSYFSHLLTLQHASFRLRYCNFVEIMVPVLSRRLLEQALPTMAETRSGFGLDFLWAEMAGRLGGDHAGRNVAVIDTVSVRHTRPVGGSLHQFIKQTGGKSSGDELVEVVSAVSARSNARIEGIAVPRIRILGGIDRAGRSVSGFGAFVSVLGDMMVRGRNRVQKPPSMKVVKHALKAGLRQRAEPSPSRQRPPCAARPSHHGQKG